MIRGKMSGVKSASDHGRFVYAYRNVQTNQIVYSLSRTLKNYRALRQLPDLGANNKPASLRKDHWKPLWTLSLPENDGARRDGRSQGLELFQALREYRKLHELSWTPPAELARPRTDEEIKKIETALEGRGGSKKENAYDIITRKKKRMRVRAVMDQKANSIADLAAVLLKQSDEKIWRLSVSRQRIPRRDQVSAMIEASEKAGNGKVESLAEEIRLLQEQIEVAKQQGTEDTESVALLDEKEKELWQLEFGRISEVEKEVTELRERMGTATQGDVKDPKSKALLWQKKKELSQLERQQRENAEVRKAKLSLAAYKQKIEAIKSELQDLDTKAKEDVLRNQIAEILDLKKQNHSLSDADRLREYDAQLELRRLRLLRKVIMRAKELPNYDMAPSYFESWSVEVPTWTATYLKENKRGLSEEVKKAIEARVAQHTDHQTPSKVVGKEATIKDFLEPFLSERKPPTKEIVAEVGPIQISWQDIMDAEFAEAWPEDVKHSAMGTVRHVAPRPEGARDLKAEKILVEKKQAKEQETRRQLVGNVKRSLLKKLELN